MKRNWQKMIQCPVYFGLGLVWMMALLVPAWAQHKPSDPKDTVKRPRLIQDDQTLLPPEKPEAPKIDPMKAQRALDVAEFYFKKKNWDAAIMRCREAIQLDPALIQAKLRLLQAIQKKKNWQQLQDTATQFKQLPAMQAHLALLETYIQEARSALKNAKPSQTKP